VADEQALLRRFVPHIAYDSQEAFFADSAEVMIAGRGTTLQAGGKTIASAGSSPPLTLGLLNGTKYSGGPTVCKDDRLSLAGHDYRTRYNEVIAARPELRNRIYGHAKRADGQLWLQYWFFYYYNDVTLGAGIGLHEGDWEMVQLLIDESVDPPAPESVVYAQHDSASERGWDQVRKADGRPDTPVVYSARGSHGSYFEAGLYDTAAWFDIADGDGPSVEHALEIVGDNSPPWVLWPGRWGDTQPGSGLWGWLLGGVQSRSPPGPVGHGQWSAPKELAAKATYRAPIDPGPPLEVTVTRVGSRLRVAYDFGRQDPPARIVVAVGAEGELGKPKRTFTLAVKRRGKGAAYVPWLTLERDRTYYVGTSTVRRDGRPSAVHDAPPLLPEARNWRETLLGSIGGAFARIAVPIGLLRTRLKGLGS
jgi:hypothetical protein